ncbi:sensor histidine kinase [Actinophytocola sp. NPDC049390]|uniref:sensor histidine kinase n=1 Tax=Actinophytocola sp. NPDC049390 TaxID=3363894 RepID=UPI0037B82FA2
MRDWQLGGALATYLGATQEPTPAGLAEVVGTAVGATGCALTVDGARYLWGTDTGPWLEHPITYQGEDVGTLAIAPAGPVDELAVAVAAPLAMVRLAAETDALRRAGDTAARELIDDRWRAAAEMEAERRGLERDLHDGAQHHLVALRMSLGLLEHAVATGGVQERVTDLLARVDNAERVLVNTAAGVLPVALVINGLAAALTTELASHPEVVLDVAGLRRRYPAVVESAVYFVCLEAVNNSRKHAPGARVTVTVRDSYRGLEFTATDNGPGFDVTAAGSGLHNLSARATAVGGTVDVRSAPGHGTRITGFVPL